ncbi:hypothetical protein TR75_04550 [Hydrogenibacillus schlegelii]|uniref:shikimate kinase n=1 Tax=Hydrogenibacillus schlegelii TaxID=1484 RepID=UPI000793B268|nr:shikimate kinase [Hydrogenibacillus schlegelii]KWX06894.1 hypothetical protein TR75_04550 [Hydrogenibacillus schlegelii]
MRHVFLVGFMSAGKTTVGPLVAARLGRRWVDMDALLEARFGRPIAAFFQTEGEAAFRREEKALLFRLTDERAPLVVSTGGGVVVDPENRARMRAAGTVVFLYAPLSAVRERVGADPARPLLAGGEAAMRALFRRRFALYRAAAHCAISTARFSPEAAAARIAAYVRHREDGHAGMPDGTQS